MKALMCNEFGPIDSLEVRDIVSPVAGVGQVLIKVEAASVNFPDALMVQGLYQVRPPTPFVPGAEIAGTIMAMGEGVSGFSVGQKVLSLCMLGGFAEMAVAPALGTIPLPDGMSFDEGAALGLTYLTSLHALKDVGQLKDGETLAILGASGGVGLAAIEIAKAMGARVIACASSDEKLKACLEAGADETINYTTESLKARLMALSDNQGVACVYDAIGGEATEAAVRALGWRGRLLVVGFAAGQIPAIPLNLALLKERQILGVYWGDSVRHDPKGHASNVRQLMAWFHEGKIRPRVTKAYPLSDGIKALQDIAGRRVIGKIVIHPKA